MPKDTGSEALSSTFRPMRHQGRRQDQLGMHWWYALRHALAGTRALNQTEPWVREGQTRNFVLGVLRSELTDVSARPCMVRHLRRPCKHGVMQALHLVRKVSDVDRTGQGVWPLSSELTDLSGKPCMVRHFIHGEIGDVDRTGQQLVTPQQ